MSENPEWLPLLSGKIALWLRETVDAAEVPPEPVEFPLATTRHGMVKIRVQLVIPEPVINRPIHRHPRWSDRAPCCGRPLRELGPGVLTTTDPKVVTCHG